MGNVVFKTSGKLNQLQLLNNFYSMNFKKLAQLFGYNLSLTTAYGGNYDNDILE